MPENFMEKQQTVFSEIVFQWLYSKNGQMSYSTFVKYEQLIKTHIKPYFDQVAHTELSQKTLESFYDSLCRRSSHLKMSNSNMRIIIMIVNHALEYAYDHHIIKEHLKIKPCLQKSKPIVRVFSLEDQKKLEQYIYRKISSYSLAILMALYSGIRIGELCVLQWKDVDFQNHSVKITKTVQRLKSRSDSSAKTQLFFSVPKSGCSCRMIPLPEFVTEYMKEFYDSCKNEEYFVIGQKSVPCEPRALQYAYQRILKRCGIPYLNFHCLRHTFATRCVTIGCDVKTLSEILGHSDIKITMDYYFHSSFEYKKQQMNKLFLLS